MDKDLIDETRKMIDDIRAMLSDLSDYLTELRHRTKAEIAEIEAARAARLTPSDPRYPYVAGRQPRRDGDSYGSVQPAPMAGSSHDDDSAGPV